MVSIEKTYSMTDQVFMQEALKQAQKASTLDEVPIGAVITFENQIIARAHNQVETLKDPTAHAEMIAITSAVNTISSKWLYDCTLYVTIEPCAMCAGALVLARIKRIIFGALDKKAGACGSVMNIIQHNQLNHQIECQQGLFEDECRKIIQKFFSKKRNSASLN